MATNRKRYTQGLAEATQDSHDTMDDTSKYAPYFKSDVKLWNPKKDETHMFDVIPYFMGDNDTRVLKGRFKKGSPTYLLDVYAHQNVGVLKSAVICPIHSGYGDSCPICEEVERLWEEVWPEYQGKGEAKEKEFKEKIVGPIKAKRRVAYNVIIRDNGKEEAKGLQVYEVAHYSMEAPLQKLVVNPRTGGKIIFSDLDAGKTVSFFRPKAGFLSGHQFLDRTGPIEEGLEDKALTLDQHIIIHDYDTLFKMFWGKSKDEVTEDDIPNFPSSEYSSEYDNEAEQENEQQEEENEPPEPEPEKPTTPKVDRLAKKKDRLRKKTAELVCPVEGGTFGDDIDDFTECIDENEKPKCPLYAECQAKYIKEYGE